MEDDFTNLQDGDAIQVRPGYDNESHWPLGRVFKIVGSGRDAQFTCACGFPVLAAQECDSERFEIVRSGPW